MNNHGVVESNEAIEIVWPLGQRERVPTVFADRLEDLSGKSIAEIWSLMWGGDVAFAVIREELKRRYPDITIIPCAQFGNIHGPNENAVVAGLGDELKRRGVDAAILGIANCGSCTPAVLRAHVAVERAGIPAVSIVGEPFIDQATAVAECLNVAGAAMAVYPGNIEADNKDLFRRKVTDDLPDPIVAGLKTGSIAMAAAEIICDPAFRLEDQGASPAWEMLLTVSGPIARELDFNAQHGVCASGRRANTSIGRFLRLYSRNIAGHRIPPGVTDYAAVGNNFYVAIAEDEARLRDLGWATDGEEQGLAPDESGVTVQGIIAASPTFFYSGATMVIPTSRSRRSATCSAPPYAVIGGSPARPTVIGTRSSCSIPTWRRRSPRMAGPRMTSAASCMKAAGFRRRSWNVGAAVMNLDLADQVRRGVLPPVYHESDDPERMVPLFVRPEWIRVVVAGAPTTCYRGYMNNHEQGVPATRKVQLPADWAARIAQRG